VVLVELFVLEFVTELVVDEPFVLELVAVFVDELLEVFVLEFVELFRDVLVELFRLLVDELFVTRLVVWSSIAS
jgi:hypothetical protein